MTDADEARRAFERALQPREQRRLSFRRVALAIALLLGVLPLALLGITAIIGLPIISDARAQLKAAFPNQRIVLHEVHVNGQECGYYSVSDTKPQRLFLVDESGVMTAPGTAAINDYVFAKLGTIARWSSCMSWGRYRHSGLDNAVAIWLVNHLAR